MTPNLSSDGSLRDHTSLSLLARLGAQDADAWRRFVYVYGPLVNSWCSRVGVRGEDAADVIQDVWAGVARSLKSFDRGAGGTFRGWLWRIARNKLADFYRNREDEARAEGGTTALDGIKAVPADEPADASAVDANASVVRRALDLIRPEFEEHNWQAFWRHGVDGRPAAEVAAELGIKANAVYQARFRVLKRLKEELHGIVEF